MRSLQRDVHSIVLHVANVDTRPEKLSISNLGPGPTDNTPDRYTQGSSRLLAPPWQKLSEVQIEQTAKEHTFDQHDLEVGVGIGQTTCHHATSGTTAVGQGDSADNDQNNSDEKTYPHTMTSTSSGCMASQELGGKVQKSAETERSRRIAASPTQIGTHLYSAWRPCA